MALVRTGGRTRAIALRVAAELRALSVKATILMGHCCHLFDNLIIHSIKQISLMIKSTDYKQMSHIKKHLKIKISLKIKKQ